MASTIAFGDVVLRRLSPVLLLPLLLLSFLPTTVSAAYPTLSAGQSLVPFRDLLRVASSAAPGFFAANELNANSFTYTLGANGRVERVVGSMATVNPGAAFAEALFDHYCDNLVTQTNAPSMNPFRPRECGKSKLSPAAAKLLDQQLDKGHIVAQSLGGSNRDPINLMPQNAVSNQRGRWKKIEQAIEFAMKAKPTLCGDGKINVDIILSYANAADVTPHGGEYQAIIPGPCWNTIIDLAKSNTAAACYKNAVAMAPPHQRVKVGAGVSVTIRTYWSNDPNDLPAVTSWDIPNFGAAVAPSATPTPTDFHVHFILGNRAHLRGNNQLTINDQLFPLSLDDSISPEDLLNAVYDELDVLAPGWDVMPSPSDELNQAIALFPTNYRILYYRGPLGNWATLLATLRASPPLLFHNIDQFKMLHYTGASFKQHGLSGGTHMMVIVDDRSTLSELTGLKAKLKSKDMECQLARRGLHVMNGEDDSPSLDCGLPFDILPIDLPELLPATLLVSELELLVLKAHNSAYARTEYSEIPLPHLANAKLGHISLANTNTFLALNGVPLDSRRLVSHYLHNGDEAEPIFHYHFELQQKPSWAIGDTSSGLTLFKIEACRTTRNIHQKLAC